MMMDRANHVITALRAAGREVHNAGEGKWIAQCPAHDDRRPSLSVGAGDDGRALVCCHAGCPTEAVVDALGLRMADLAPPEDNHGCKAGGPTGKIAAHYDYRDAEGKLLFRVLRYEPKDFRQVRPDGNGGWIWNVHGVPRVLYRLPELLAADPGKAVFVVEGEKDVETVNSLCLPATCNPGGAGKWHTLSDDSVLSGRHVVILPDKDDPGRKHADDVASRLHGRAASIRILELPGDGKDVSDWVEQLDAREPSELCSALLDMAAQAPEWQPTPAKAAPSRLSGKKDSLPWRSYPVDVLVSPVKEYVISVAEAIGVDPVFAALPALAMAGSCIGTTRAASPKEGWHEPGIVWAGIVAESGNKKSPVLRQVLSPLRKTDSQCIEENRHLREDYDTQLAAFHAQNRKGETDERPQRPAYIRHVVRDTTSEALIQILADNPRGVLLDDDELSGWIAGFDRYRKQGGADVAFWLSAWSAERAVVDRASKPTVYADRAAVSVTGMIQPGVLRRIIGTEHRENGLLPRMLLALPPKQPTFWTDKTVDRELERRIKCVVGSLLELDFGQDGEPVVVPLDADARV
ncbi:MAG TPA: DUF3987 domain-containing protein, partial [Planctomycetota bacterium]|nr:DUF3987 domain-containing protein [Planctomycetota bacterium]